jgi:hypothetical protein
MQIEVDVSRWYDWRLKHHSEVGPDEVAVDSPAHGPGLKLAQTLRDDPSTTFVHIPDADVERMVREHREAVASARTGYTARQEGGPAHGEEVVVPPRHLPTKSRDQLIAEHLEDAVMPHHAPSEHITAVRVVDADMPEAERGRLERYLSARLAAPPPDSAEEAPAAEEEPREGADL